MTHRLPLHSTSWFLISCFVAICMVTAPAAQAIEPKTFHSDDFAPRSLMLKGASFEPAGRRASVEDPPDMVKTAIVPGSVNDQAASNGGYAPANNWNGGNGGFTPPFPTNPGYGSSVPQGGFGNPGYGPGNGSGYGPANGGGYGPTNGAGYGPTAPRGGYQPQPYQPAKPSDEELHDAKVTARYQDSTYLGFLARTNMSQITSIYIEASNLIDTRHVSPTSYEVRTQTALRGLVVALNNRAFQQASGAAPRPEQIQAFQSDLSQVMNSQGPRTANEAIGVMQWVAAMGSQRLGLRQEVVAMEFLNETLDSLDKYSSFMPNKSSAALETELHKTAALEESIVGIGVELKTHEQGALIMGVIEGSPSAEVGLKKGDILVSINGQELAGMPLSQVADQITGRTGTTVMINIRRNGQRFAATLARRAVYVSSVSGVQMVEGSRVGYIRLKQFSESSTKDLEAAMMKLHNAGMQSLILDLRGNPGGLLTQSVTVSDLFLTQGTIVSTRGRNDSDNSTEAAKFDRTWSTPLAVLVDDNSASASEIFAAAIQDNRRGVLVGRKSYGKGTVQTHFPMKSANANLKLTTAKFYAPSGREMAGQGVTPEYVVNQPNADLANTLTEDADVVAALQAIQSGVPTQLAQGRPVQQYGNQQFGSQPYGTQQYGTQPYGNQPQAGGVPGLASYPQLFNSNLNGQPNGPMNYPGASGR